MTEACAARSPSTDLASGLSFAKGLRTAQVATAFAGTLFDGDTDTHIRAARGADATS